MRKPCGAWRTLVVPRTSAIAHGIKASTEDDPTLSKFGAESQPLESWAKDPDEAS